MEKDIDILCIGSATMDFIARPSKAERIDINSLDRAEHLMCLTFASKTLLDDLSYEPGGSAANAAVAMTLLGAKVQVLTAVGSDFFGEMILHDLSKRGVGTDYCVRVPKKKSSIGISILSQGGEKTTLVYRGANDFLAPSHLSEEAVRRSKAIFITSLTSPLNYSLMQRAIRLAHRYKAKIIFAPSITMLKRFRTRLMRMHERFDLCVANHEEGMYYTGKSEIAAVLEALPGKERVITSDKKGAYALAGYKRYHIGAPDVRVVDTTGAGDAFTGALAAEYLRGGDLKAALSTATALAGIKLESLGPKIDMPAEKIAKQLEQRARKLTAKEWHGD